MTDIQTRPTMTPTEGAAEPSPHARRGTTVVVVGAIVVVVVLALAAVVVPAVVDDDGGDGETADVLGQGSAGPVLAADGARLERGEDRLYAEIDVPTPEPGSYEYPTADMVAPWADPHPPVSPGATNAPEVFTAWVFVFNEPELCTDGRCDLDDVGADTAAGGGGYQLDGRIGTDDRLTFTGNIRLGEPPMHGATLSNPIGAEVHFSIAPHGRALPGEDGWRQLNGPIGNPALWWPAAFPPPE